MPSQRRSIINLVIIALLFSGVIVLLAAVLVFSLPQALTGMPPVAEIFDSPPPTAFYYQAPAGATPTPTPFQPLPPAPYFDFASALGLPPADLVVPPVAVAVETLPPPTPTIPANLLPLDPSAPTPTEQSLPESATEQVNILLLGADARPGSTNFRTDTIILVTLNPSLDKVSVLSFPRDMYLSLPGWGQNRINTAWTYGGWKLLRKTFKANFGVVVDHYVLINFSSFKQLIDSLGGLDVEVGNTLSDYRYGYWVTIPKGEVHMDADNVLWYVRSRKTTNDIARNRRQQEVLQAMLRKFMSLDALRRAPEFYDLYKKNVTTDLGLTDMLYWLPAVMRVIDSQNIKYYSINYNHLYDYITPGGAMVLLPNMDAIMGVIRKSQNIP